MIATLSFVLLGIAFVLAIVATHLLAYRRSTEIDRRLLEVAGEGGFVRAVGIRGRRGSSFFARMVAFAATLAPRSVSGQGLKDQLAGAGLYSTDAVRVFIGSKVLFAGLLAAATFPVLTFLHRPQTEMALFSALAGLIGFQLPAIWLAARSSRRQTAIRLALPDCLDLMVVSVEAGLGLNSAIVRVGREMERTCPALSQELMFVNQEIRAGTSRSTALRNFVRRVPIPDVQGLVAMLIQTDRLGTSVANSLRVHANSLRTKRRQRAEERARKATVKLVFPLVLFIFPEMMVIMLGPAGLQLFRALYAVATKQPS
jgi:tight adherence protein C